MAWRNDRKRSFTFRKRVPRGHVAGFDLNGSGAHVFACMALLMPLQRGSSLDHIQNWVLLVRTVASARAHQKMLDGVSNHSENEKNTR
jgi:hypothetical protein